MASECLKKVARAWTHYSAWQLSSPSHPLLHAAGFLPTIERCGKTVQMLLSEDEVRHKLNEEPADLPELPGTRSCLALHR